MAAAGFTPIQIYYSTTASAVPTAGNLLPGELALNIADMKLYCENSSGVVTLLASASGASGNVVGPASAVANNIALFDGTTGKLIKDGSQGLPVGTIVGTSDSQTLTNKTINGSNNTITNISLTTAVTGTLPVANGGTGQTSYTDGQLLIGNTATTGLTKATLTAGSNVTITNGNGTITIASTNPGGDVVGPASATDNAIVRFDGTTGKLVQNSAVTVADTTGDITGGAYNKVTITAPATSATLTIANGKTLTANASLTLAGVDAKTLTVNNSLTLAGTDATTMTFPSSSATLAGLGISQTFTGTQTFNGTSSVLGMVIVDAAETTTVSATAATGTINYDVTTQSVLFYTTNASANWTVNLRGSSGTSMNTLLSTGQSITVAFLVTQGATAYYNTTVQVDGTTSGVTTRWQGGTAPTAGNASGVDVYTYTVVKTGSATFSVFASQTRFA